MKKTMTLLVLSGALLLGCGGKKQNEPGQHADNPFFQTWDTPYQVPPFEKIKLEHYKPAFEEGIKIQKEEIASIIENTEKPNFANTIEALEYSGAMLYNVQAVFFNLRECVGDDEMKKLGEELDKMVTQHGDDINLNARLFEKVKVVYENRQTENLTPEQLRLTEETYNNFVRGGANVPAEKQARFREINEKIAALSNKFGDNVLAATNEYKLVVDDVAQLEGLTDDQLAAALEVGNSSEETKGKYVFGLSLPSWEPFMQNCKNRELREEMWKAYAYRCASGAFDNALIIDELVNLRLERANILGYPSHAAFVLDNNMAKTPQTVNDLLMTVWEPALKKAKVEAAEYNAMIKKEGGGFQLTPADWRYYSEKIRKEKYALNDETIRPYFSLEGVKQGIFMVCNNLYGITFEKNNTIPTYSPEAEAYEVKENGKTIAVLYMDYHPRATKRPGAWMTNFREQYVDKEGNNVIPVVSLVMNFTPPVGDKPSLLNFDQTETFFHEFGHGLHSIFSKCHYRSLSGTNVSRDFVELPSQIMEKWAGEPEVMKLYAKHYQTGEVIPDDLITKLEAAATYGQGFINTELLAASFLDMSYYTITEPAKVTLPDFEDNAMKQIGLIPEIISRYKSPYFQHIFSGGYSSGYYSYTWSAVLDSDAFEAFREKGVFNKEVADSYRKNILERGNTEDPMILYKRFRGQEPSTTPLLRNRGLIN
ncbi:M3 family metallopeptidase [Bacteroidales bacterium OttesenSCG-928-B11]|nr:M3 family metallopeptidase [Bacteroidales bacterium OttesenSCG-928-C03]MDL2313229.1 M3 family metallopeptidase [Bacteroidales bacterium OttesenSCG-928-B11]